MIKAKVEEHRSPKINADTIEIDFSATDSYLKCGKRYEFRYVKGLKSPPSVALLEGSSHHKAMEVNNLHKRETGKDRHPKVMSEIFMEDFRSRTAREERLDWEEETEDKVFKRAKSIHLEYARVVAPKIKPVMIEEKFQREFKLNGKTYNIYGTIDLTEETPVLYDYKTVARARSQGDVDDSLQLSLYSFATKIKTVGIISLVKKANPEIVVVESMRSSSQIIWALNIVASVADAVQKGVFPLTSPDSWWCSQRFCGYWDSCRGRYR